MFDTIPPGGGRTQGRRVRYQVLRIAVPRRGRALPLLEVCYDRDRMPADASQNQLEEHAIAAVLQALPAGVRPVVLADRGFARATFSKNMRSPPSCRRCRPGSAQSCWPTAASPAPPSWHGSKHIASTMWSASTGGPASPSQDQAGAAGSSARNGWRAGSSRLPPGCATGSTTAAPATLRSTLPCRGACRPATAVTAPHATRPALVPGDQPRRRAARRGVVLAAGLDRAVLQRRQGPLRPRQGAGRQPRAAVAAAGRPGARAGLADPARAARGRPAAAGLARPRRPARPSQPHHPRLGLAGSPWRPPTRLPARSRRWWVCVSGKCFVDSSGASARECVVAEGPLPTREP